MTAAYLLVLECENEISGSLVWELRQMVTSNRRRLLLKSIRLILWLALLLGFYFPSVVYAQQKPVTIESSTMQPSVVMGRPILTWWDVKIPGSGLLVGKFRFLIHSEGYQFATLETEELTLNGPEQRIRVMLPAIDCPQLIDRLYVDISFKGAKFSGDLGQHILRVPFATKSVFISLVGESRTVRKRSPQRDKLIERLKFETLIPMPKNRVGEIEESEYVQTIFASIEPADFPTEPLSYCGYDLVILMRDEFRGLRKPQLEGLLAWIRAGGSLYLEPNGVLESYHLDFLRSLIQDDPQDLVFQLDAAGKVPADTIPPDRVAMTLKCGLGDVVIRTDDPDQPIDISIDDWRAIVGPLWKWRSKPVERPSVTSFVVGPNGQPLQESSPNPDPWGFSMALFNRHSLNSTELLDRLMPEGVRMVPLSLLAFILLAFVIMIGPGDYIVLGWFKARKLTWLTFPLATLGVTALTVWISNSYMSAAEARRTMIVQDLGPQGDIVRTNRFELLFVASTHQVATEVEKGLLTPLKTSSNFDMSGLVFTNQNGQLVSMSSGMGVNTASGGQNRSLPPLVQGRIPSQSITFQDLSKWTPQINRVMSLSNLPIAPEVDWSEFDLKIEESQVLRSHAVPPALVAQVHDRFGQNALVACFSGHEGWASDRAPGWRSTRSLDSPQQHLYYPIQYSGYSTTPMMSQMVYEADLFRWIYQASIAPLNQGAFSLTKKTSPKGGAYGDDLPLLDITDPHAWLLVVIVPGNDEYVVYRKLMRFLD